MAQIPRAHDRLLAGEAAFFVGDRLGGPVYLHGERVFRDIDAVERHPGLNAKGMEGRGASRNGACCD